MFCLFHCCAFYFTRFKRGFAFFAEGDALRDDDANIAPACFIDTPSFLAIDFCTALKPGCLLFISFIPLVV